MYYYICFNKLDKTILTRAYRLVGYIFKIVVSKVSACVKVPHIKSHTHHNITHFLKLVVGIQYAINTATDNELSNIYMHPHSTILFIIRLIQSYNVSSIIEFISIDCYHSVRIPFNTNVRSCINFLTKLNQKGKTKKKKNSKNCLSKTSNE